MNKDDFIVTIHRSHRAALCQERDFRRWLMVPGRSAAGLVVLLWTACAAMPIHASDLLQPLTIAIVESSGGETYFVPEGRRIVIKAQPIHLFIRIRNTSDSAVLIRVKPEKAYSIELKDQAGQISMVKRKTVIGVQTDDDTRGDLAQGADRIIPMIINRDRWDGIPELEPGKESKYTARVVYETADGQLIYSEPYTLTFSISK